MRWSKGWIWIAGLLMMFFIMGCYTVVMVPGTRTVRRVETDDVIVEEDEYEDVIDEYGEEPTVIHEHYIYGDLWPSHVYFDPYWSSPYWWRYSSWWAGASTGVTGPSSARWASSRRPSLWGR